MVGVGCRVGMGVGVGVGVGVGMEVGVEWLYLVPLSPHYPHTIH